MKKDDAEERVRLETQRWAQANNIPMDGSGDPSFAAFSNWLHDRAPECFNFRARGGSDYIIEMWWASEMRQTWRY